MTMAILMVYIKKNGQSYQDGCNLRYCDAKNAVGTVPHYQTDGFWYTINGIKENVPLRIRLTLVSDYQFKTLILILYQYELWQIEQLEEYFKCYWNYNTIINSEVVQLFRTLFT